MFSVDSTHHVFFPMIEPDFVPLQATKNHWGITSQETDPAVEPVLLRQTFKKGSAWLGGQRMFGSWSHFRLVHWGKSRNNYVRYIHVYQWYLRKNKIYHDISMSMILTNKIKGFKRIRYYWVSYIIVVPRPSKCLENSGNIPIILGTCGNFYGLEGLRRYFFMLTLGTLTISAVSGLWSAWARWVSASAHHSLYDPLNQCFKIFGGGLQPYNLSLAAWNSCFSPCSSFFRPWPPHRIASRPLNGPRASSSTWPRSYEIRTTCQRHSLAL